MNNSRKRGSSHILPLIIILLGLITSGVYNTMNHVLQSRQLSSVGKQIEAQKVEYKKISERVEILAKTIVALADTNKSAAKIRDAYGISVADKTDTTALPVQKK